MSFLQAIGSTLGRVGTSANSQPQSWLRLGSTIGSMYNQSRITKADNRLASAQARSLANQSRREDILLREQIRAMRAQEQQASQTQRIAMMREALGGLSGGGKGLGGGSLLPIVAILLMSSSTGK